MFCSEFCESLIFNYLASFSVVCAFTKLLQHTTAPPALACFPPSRKIWVIVSVTSSGFLNPPFPFPNHGRKRKEKKKKKATHWHGRLWGSGKHWSIFRACMELIYPKAVGGDSLSLFHACTELLVSGDFGYLFLLFRLKSPLSEPFLSWKIEALVSRVVIHM